MVKRPKIGKREALDAAGLPLSQSGILRLSRLRSGAIEKIRQKTGRSALQKQCEFISALCVRVLFD
jgi:hypothetical protein